METHKTVQVIVSGKVQGVWYRGWTVGKAQELNLNGWVRNLTDGRVEVLVSGAHHSVDIFLEALHQGPRAAKVSDIVVVSVVNTPKKGFFQLATN